jgi:predicted ATPase
MEPTRAEAEARWDMLFGRGKTLLIDRHYDSVTGKKKTIFPFTQVIRAGYVHDDDEVRG